MIKIPHQISTISVIGAGQMGRGIAQVAASADFNVFLYDINQDILNKSISNVEQSLKKLAEKKKITQQPEEILRRIVTTTQLSDLAQSDFVIEAVSENEDLKKKIFSNLDGLIKKDVFFASNTSSISITRLSMATSRPEKFIGMHFMNPVPIMSLVEIIKGHKTSDETYDVTRHLVEKMGKQSVCSLDYPGFIVNRVLMPMINEAFYALMEGVGTALDIDNGMKLGSNQPMGPLALADFIGLDTCYAIMEVLHNGLGDTKYRPCPLLRKYVDAGCLGRKVGRGVYEY